MNVRKDKTEELRLGDLIPGPPMPPGKRAPTPPPPASTRAFAPPSAPIATTEATVPTAEPRASTPEPQPAVAPPPEVVAHPGPPSEPRRHTATANHAIRMPARRLWRVYFVTCQVVVSYTSLRFRGWLRSSDARALMLERAHRANAGRIKDAIVDLQGLFIKVGQLISIMANFLPEAFRRELEELQDKVPPRPYEDIEERLIEEFNGRNPSQVFAEIAREPIAAASIGQVHVARLPTGEKVAVKIQYPDIEEIVRTDLKALRRVFWVLRYLMPSWGFETIYREIREMVMAELDYKLEAQAMETVAKNFAGRDDVRVPRVMREFSTTRVLTTEWMSGTKVADRAGLDVAGVDRKQVARLFVDAYCHQIFVDGFYHADPHPGNLLVERMPDGRPRIVFIDFGATATVPDSMRKGMLSFLQGAATRDTARLVGAMKEMGFISRRADPEVFDKVVEYFHDKLRAEVLVEGFSLKDIRFDPEKKLDSLLDLREMNVSLADVRDAFHVPKQWVMLERALLLLLGVCTTLDPEMHPTTVIKPYLERFLVGERANLSEAALDATREAALSVLSLPSELRRVIGQACLGNLEVRVGNLREGAQLMYAAGQQLLWGMLGATSATLAVVFDGRGQADAVFWAKGATGLFGLLLVRALLFGRRQRQRVL